MKFFIIFLLILVLLGIVVFLYSVLQIIPDEYDKDIDIIDYDGTPDDDEEEIIDD